VKAPQVLENLRELVRLGAMKPDASSLFHRLADCVPVAQLENGQRILDAMDFAVWLRELGEAARTSAVDEHPSYHTPTELHRRKF